MKQLFPFLFIAILLTSCGASHKAASTSYIIVPDANTKVLKGVISRSLIENDTSFAWFKENMKWGQADPAAIDAFKKNAGKFKMVVFGGTWCHDTQNLLPVFYRLVDKSGYDEKNITLIAVDRSKQTLNDLHTTYHITNVPTFIVFQDGKEIGRIVEYGKYSMIDKELGEIVNSIK